MKAVTRDPRGEILLHLREGQLSPKSCSEVLLVQIKDTAFHCKHMNILFYDQGCCGFDDIHLIREGLVVSQKIGSACRNRFLSMKELLDRMLKL